MREVMLMCFMLALLAFANAMPHRRSVHNVQGNSEHRVVCYFTNWAQYRPGSAKFVAGNMDPTLCTHLIFSFAKLSDSFNNRLEPFEWNDESTEWSVGNYEALNQLKTVRPDLKTLLAVGGWTHGVQKFTHMSETPERRQVFIQDAIQFVRARNFDGLDLDWEFPGYTERGSPAADKQRFTLLVQELRAAFEAEALRENRERLLLTAACSAGPAIIESGYEITKIARDLDFINVMAYDLHGSWETMTGHHTALYSGNTDVGYSHQLTVSNAVRVWLDGGAPASKLILGMGLYGRSFTLADHAMGEGVGLPTSGPGEAGISTRTAGFLAYYEICSQLGSGQLSEAWDVERQVPYGHSDNQWIGYDNPESLTIKVNFLKEMGLGGAMVWAVDLDDFNGNCGEKWPLMKAINRALSSVPADGEPAAEVPADGEPATEVPADGEPAAEVPAGGEPAAELPAGGEPAAEVPADGEPAAEVPADGEPAAEVPADGEPAAEVPAGGEPAAEVPAGGEPATEVPADGEPAAEVPAGEETATGAAPAGGEPAAEVPADGEPAAEVPADGEPATEVPADGEPAAEVPAGEETATGAAPAGGEPAAEVPADGEPAAEVPAGGEPAAEVPADGEPAPEVPAGEETATGAAPAGGEPANEAPAGGEPANEVPAGGEPAAEVPAGGEPAAEVPADGEPAAEVPADGEPAAEVPADGEPAPEVPAGEETATGAAPAGGEPANEAPAGGEPATEVPADGEPATEVPAGGEPATEVPAGGEPATEAPAGGEPATEVPADGEPATEVPAGGEPATEAAVGGGPATDTVTTDSPTSDTFSCHGRASGYYADPESCRMYYICNNGIGERLPCAGGLHYDQASSTCNLPHLAQCHAPETPLFCDDQPDGLYTNPSDCASYYQCSGALTYIRFCSSGLQWNAYNLVCDWPRNVDCDRSSVFSCTDRTLNYYPHPTDCTGFFQCAGGRTYRKSCGHLYWNQEISACDYPSNVQCNVSN